MTCGDCLTKCKFGALHYGHPAKDVADHNKTKLEELEAKAHAERQAPKSKDGADTGRRNFLLGMAMMSSSLAFSQAKKKLDGGLAEIEEKQLPERTTPVTPPSSLSAQNLAHHCTACQLCVAECPNEILRPSTDPEHFVQPVMDFERGYCRPECTRCSEVCPTGAVKPITKAAKSSTHIGHAVYSHFNCVVPLL